jgi:hypothetical protein
MFAVQLCHTLTVDAVTLRYLRYGPCVARLFTNQAGDIRTSLGSGLLQLHTQHPATSAAQH